jgi:hypothetical protein
MQPALPVAVVAAGRDIGEVERRRTPAPDPGGARPDCFWASMNAFIAARSTPGVLMKMPIR